LLVVIYSCTNSARTDGRQEQEVGSVKSNGFPVHAQKRQMGGAEL